MSDVNMAEAELPLESVGAQLARAREAAGLTRAELAGQTRIPERHLAAIEVGDFAALPGRTYAVGFSRTYAKALGLDETAIAAAVREELSAAEPEDPRRTVQAFEPGDPARVPSRRLAWTAMAGVAIVLLAVLYFARGMIMPAGSLDSILPPDQPAPTATPAAQPAAPAPTPSGGPVVFTGLQPGVWVKFYDGAGNQLLQKQLAQGESYTVPAGTPDVKLWTARPDALAITIGGQPVPKLSDQQKTMKDVPVSAAALLARGAAAPVAQPIAVPVAASPHSAAHRPSGHAVSNGGPTPAVPAPTAAAPAPSASAPAPAPAPAAT